MEAPHMVHKNNQFARSKINTKLKFQCEHFVQQEVNTCYACIDWFFFEGNLINHFFQHSFSYDHAYAQTLPTLSEGDCSESEDEVIVKAPRLATTGKKVQQEEYTQIAEFRTDVNGVRKLYDAGHLLTLQGTFENGKRKTYGCRVNKNTTNPCKRYGYVKDDMVAFRGQHMH